MFDMMSSRLTALQELIARHGASSHKPLEAMPNISLIRMAAPTEPTGHMVEPIFAVVAQGRKRVGLGDGLYEYETGQYLVISVDLPLSTHAVVGATSECPFLGFSMKLRADSIATLLIEAKLSLPGSATSKGLGISDLSEDIIDPLIRLLRLLDQPADIPVLAASLEREILWRLVNGPQGDRIRQIGLANSTITKISCSIDWLRKHHARPVRIEELAELAGMSVTSFHRHFRSVTSMTPIQFQKQIRLQAARSRLLLDDCGEVASIAFDVGYNSPSQFSREYRQLFGRSPAADGRYLREKSRLANVDERS